MMNAPRSQNPFWLGLLTVSLLALLSLLKPGLRVFGVELRPVRLLADVQQPAPDPADALPDEAADLAGPLPPPNGPAAPADSAQTRPAPAASPDAARPAGPAVANLGGLDRFFAALHQAKTSGQPVRVAYFGDSMIEGDLITGALRDFLQHDFGGEGVGFVPANSVTAEFRETIHQTFSADWQQYDLVTRKLPAQYPLGVSGHVFLPRVPGGAPVAAPPAPAPPAEPDAAADSVAPVVLSAEKTAPAPPPAPAPAAVDPHQASWVQYRAGVRRLGRKIRLFYGPGASADAVQVSYDGRPATARALAGPDRLNELDLSPAAPARQVRLSFAVHGPRPVYGVSFEGPRGGVVLDNLSFRGNSGMPLGRIPQSQLDLFGRALDYRLVILHYGVNIADARNKSYLFYEQAMGRVLARLQHAFPQASFLVVGMSDKSVHLNGEYVTDPSVPRLLRAQQRLARRHGAAFWNLFEAMGGENAMPTWVDATPPLANKDYTHVNYRGGRKIALLLYNYLMQEYRKTAPPAVPAAPATAPESPATPAP